MEARWDKRADGINTSIQHSTQLLQGLHFLKIQIKFADKEKKIPFLNICLLSLYSYFHCYQYHDTNRISLHMAFRRDAHDGLSQVTTS